MAWSHTVGGTRYLFDDLKTLLACATPERSGDQLAGIAARRRGPFSRPATRSA